MTPPKAPDAETECPSCVAWMEENETLAARVRALEEGLRGLLALIDEGWLVRNTTNDAHFPSYLSESMQLVKALGAAQALLVPESPGTEPNA